MSRTLLATALLLLTGCGGGEDLMQQMNDANVEMMAHLERQRECTKSKETTCVEFMKTAPAKEAKLKAKIEAIRVKLKEKHP
jgi:hypothetical protein